MAQPSEIEQLAERRRLLVAESGRLRSQVDAELAHLAPVLNRVDKGLLVAHALRSYWPFIAAAAGFLFARKKGSWFRSLPKLLSVWRLARKLTGLWQGFSGRL